MQSAPDEPARRMSTVLPISARKLVLARGGRELVDCVDIDIPAAGGPIVILGPNGAGKSVLLRLLAGLAAPDSGTVHWRGVAPDRDRARAIGFVFQRPVLLRRTALANVEFALAVSGVGAAERRQRAIRALERAGLDHLAQSPARVLSGGEQQRLALARALSLRPEMLILDEPTANLDPASILAIEAEIRHAHHTGKQILLVTQDLGQARRLAGEVVFMSHGKVSERRPAHAFFTSPASPDAAAFLRGEILI